jgi:two-component system sensor histidine kinase BaeS
MPAFQDMVVTEAEGNFHSNILDYYANTGDVTFAGFADYMSARFGGPPPPRDQPPPPPGAPNAEAKPEAAPAGAKRPVQFGFADIHNKVIIPGSDWQMGDVLTASVIAKGTPVLYQGKRVGTIVVPAVPVDPSDAQAAFFGRLQTALFWAGLLGAAGAAGAGMVLAHGITGPIRKLTLAAREVAAGRLAQTVPAKGGDELAELANAFNRMSADLDRYETARRQMAADIAHELRTPLTTISGYVEAMKDGDLQATPERLESVFRQAQRLARIIEDLRLLSMADVGALPLETARVSVRELIVHSVQAHVLRAQERGIGLRAEVEDEVPFVEADPGRIQQVIEILVNNALRHTDQGEIVVRSTADAGTAIIQVQDTGSGIDPEVLPRLFDRFYRGEAARARDAQGSGLGLAIAHAIVKAHNGTIAVASQLAQGTVFTIRIPAATPAMAPA